MLQPGDRMPFFDVATTAGGRASYRELWQRRNVVLVRVPDGPESEPYVTGLEERRAGIEEHAATMVITSEAVEGLPGGVVIADRWGEIHQVATDGIVNAATARLSDETCGREQRTAIHDSAMPDADAIVEWLQYVQLKCPECEGESR